MVPGSIGGLFTVQQGRAAGLSGRDLRSPHLYRPLRGVRCLQEPAELVDKCRAVLAVAPEGSAISHITAAQLHGFWLPRVEDLRVHIIRPSRTHRIRRPQVGDHQGLAGRQVVAVDGLPVIAAGDTWADLYATLSVPDLVAAGDGIARDPERLDELAQAVAWRSERRCAGVVRLRHALLLVRSGSASRMESIGRWILLAGGLPEPSLNYVIRDEAGEWLAMVDYAWVEARVCAEYQSREFHKEREPMDEAKRRLVEQLGWAVVFIYPRDLAQDVRARALVGNIHGKLRAGAPRFRR